MNKYTARALNQEAALGRRVLVVSGTWRHAADAYAELTAAAYPTVTRTIRAEGRQRIEYASGGRIHFANAPGQAGRGLSVDTVLIEPDAEYRNPHVAEDVLPCIQASPHGEVIRA